VLLHHLRVVAVADLLEQERVEETDGRGQLLHSARVSFFFRVGESDDYAARGALCLVGEVGWWISWALS